MYTNINFETFIKSVSMMTGFTENQVMTLLAYRDVKYLDETTAANLTEELNKLRNEMIKAYPSGFGLRRTGTPSFPLDHLTEVAGSLSLEELLLMVFIDCPDIKITEGKKLKSFVLGHRMAIASGMFERDLIPYRRALQLSGFMDSRDFYVYLSKRISTKAHESLRHIEEDLKGKGCAPAYPAMHQPVQGPESIRKNIKGPINDYILEFSDKVGAFITNSMNPETIQISKVLLKQEENICNFMKFFYGETEAAKLGKFLVLALSDKSFDGVLGKKVCSGHRGLTLREMRFTIFLYFYNKGIENTAFEPGLLQANSNLINMIIAHAYEYNIIKVNPGDHGHYRAPEGERLHAMLRDEEITGEGKYVDQIDFDALEDYINIAKTLNEDEQALFMAVRFPAFLLNPEKVLSGGIRGASSRRDGVTITRVGLAYSMYKKNAVSLEMASTLAGKPLEEFIVDIGAQKAGLHLKNFGPAGQKDYKPSRPDGQDKVKR